MHRILFELPIPGLPEPVRIYSYGFLLMLAFAIGTWLAARRVRQAGLSAQVAIDIALYSVVAGIIGARLAFLLFDYVPDPGKNTLLDMAAIWRGGLTFQGGLLLALFVCIWYLKAHKLRAGVVADAFAPAVAMGVALGRVGCFLNGCCWGTIAPPGHPLAVRFPAGSPAFGYHRYLMHMEQLLPRLEEAGYSGVPELQQYSCPVYPTQLYTTAAMLGLFLLLLLVERLPRLFDGMVMLVFVFLYSVVRFVIEFWRDDTLPYFAYGAFPGLKLGQIFAVLMAIASLAAFLYFALAVRDGGGAKGDGEAQAGANGDDGGDGGDGGA